MNINWKIKIYRVFLQIKNNYSSILKHNIVLDEKQETIRNIVLKKIKDENTVILTNPYDTDSITVKSYGLIILIRSKSVEIIDYNNQLEVIFENDKIFPIKNDINKEVMRRIRAIEKTGRSIVLNNLKKIV